MSLGLPANPASAKRTLARHALLAVCSIRLVLQECLHPGSHSWACLAQSENLARTPVLARVRAFRAPSGLDSSRRCLCANAKACVSSLSLCAPASFLVQARDGFLAAAQEAARLKKKFKTQQAVTDALGQVRSRAFILVTLSSLFHVCRVLQFRTKSAEDTLALAQCLSSYWNHLLAD